MTAILLKRTLRHLISPSKSNLPIFSSTLRPFSSSDPPNPPPAPETSSAVNPPSRETSTASSASSSLPDLRKPSPPPFEDVDNKELKRRIELYHNGRDEEALPSVMEAILARRLSGKHEDTDDEVIEELRMKPLDDVPDREVESDFEDAYETDEEIDNLYNARQYVQRKMASDEFFNMSPSKWDGMILEATEKGFLKDTKECEDILEDMLNWDNLLPDEIKKKVEVKYNELEEMVGRGEMEPEKAYELFKEFEDAAVWECTEMMKAEEETPGPDDAVEKAKKVRLDDPPGEGPILRWESRCVFAPGGDAWHPKNRKVKLAVTVKELELSRPAFRRLRELVGKRYHPGRDELTITSERFDHREENRKDCLRTLYALIEESMKADKLVEEARKAHVKDRLKANPQFMERLKTRTAAMRGAKPVQL